MAQILLTPVYRGLLSGIAMSIRVSHGYLPAGRYVVNHDIMHCTAEGVVGNNLYSGRALGLSEPDDYIQLHPVLKPLWKHITAHYGRVGLSHSESVIWDLSLEQLARHTGYRPSVFYFGPAENKAWNDQEWLEAVEFINSKNNFMALADDLGIDVPQTQCFDSVDEISEMDIISFNMPCYLKAAISVSGVGIYRCANREELRDAIQEFASDVPVQLQEEIKTEVFLNMQYRVIGDRLVRLAVSEQILDGCAHQGNRFPSSHEPWETIEPMALWLKERGMKGIFAFDVAVVDTPDGVRYPAVECNPRFNGASYPTIIAQKLDIPEWSARTFKTRYRKLSDLDISDLEFDMKTGEGIVIVNWGTILMGKLVILMAGSPEHREVLVNELRYRL
ncbi:ATP-grasp domain-containing protein [Gammaproteobacteria bacterium]|nr:ATP-grasp domain-containing protein [Gammaproteobacteria bacterium]